MSWCLSPLPPAKYPLPLLPTQTRLSHSQPFTAPKINIPRHVSSSKIRGYTETSHHPFPISLGSTRYSVLGLFSAMLSGSLPSGWDHGSGGGSSQPDFPNTEYRCKINIYSALLIKLFYFPIGNSQFLCSDRLQAFLQFNSANNPLLPLIFIIYFSCIKQGAALPGQISPLKMLP